MFARIRSTRGAGIIIDLLMLVVGINIALWFEGLAEEYGEREAEQQYLLGLRDDLESDITLMDAVIRLNEEKLEQLQAIIPTLDALGDQPPERVQETIFTPSSYNFFQPSDFTYTSMQESGDFRLLSDPDLKKGILKLVRRYRLVDELQRNFIQALDDEYIPLMMSRYDIKESRLSDPTLVDDQVFRNFFMFTYQDTDQRVRVLRSSREQAQGLLEAIEAQI